jgi:hypothetical protein
MATKGLVTVGKWYMFHKDGMWWRGKVIDVAFGGTYGLLYPAWSICRTGDFKEATMGSVDTEEKLESASKEEPVKLPLVGSTIVPYIPKKGEEEA